MTDALSPWQTPTPAVVENPYTHNRTIDSSIGNAYGANNIGPALPGFTPGSLTPAVKAEIIANVDAMLLAIWPFDYTVENGIVRIALRHRRMGIPLDPRVPGYLAAQAAAGNAADPCAPCDDRCNPAYLIPDAIAAASPFQEGTTDQRYGGAPSPFIDWDRMDFAMIEKMYQLWYNFKMLVTAA